MWLGAVVGAPAYLNGYAAVPLVDALLAQGMANGAAMSFMVAGGVSSIPAALAVWALVKPRVFAAYMGFAITGATLTGVVWQFVQDHADHRFLHLAHSCFSTLGRWPRIRQRLPPLPCHSKIR